MRSSIQGLQPQLLWEHFYQISQIPRGSGNEEAVGQYIISVAEKNGLEFQKDESGNIVVKCPASPGFENRPTVIIQGHTDMVCEKNNDTVHDFEKDPIKLVRDGEWLRADGTTLGSDNGIGVCAALAIMADPSIKHPPMEMLFTVDEETGLTGAENLKPGFLNGRIMLNLDSEEDGALYIGCAGGKHTILRRKIDWRDAPAGMQAFAVKIGGLKGGHSGLNIPDGLGNANKLLSRFLYALSGRISFKLAAFDGGNKHNAIPREAEALILLQPGDSDNLKKTASEFDAIFKNELSLTDDKVFLKTEETASPSKVFEDTLTADLLRTVYAMPHGVIAMSFAIEGLVETSTNMAIVETGENTLFMLTSQRSSVASSIDDIADKVKALGELGDFAVEQGGGYPAWQPNPDSPILKLAVDTYKSKYGNEPEVKAIHAGLECGIIAEKYPGMDMVSFGPTITGAHSPDERVKIADVAKMWDFLLELLIRIE